MIDLTNDSDDINSSRTSVNSDPEISNNSPIELSSSTSSSSSSKDQLNTPVEDINEMSQPFFDDQMDFFGYDDMSGIVTMDDHIINDNRDDSASSLPIEQNQNQSVSSSQILASCPTVKEPAKKRQCRTREEIEAEKIAKVTREEQKELKRKEKVEKEQKKIVEKEKREASKAVSVSVVELKEERRQKQAEKDQLKEIKKVQKERQKSVNSEAEKYVTTVVDRNLLQLTVEIPGAKLENALNEFFDGVSWQLDSNPIPDSVVWVKTVIDGDVVESSSAGSSSQEFKRIERIKYEDQIVIFVKVVDFKDAIKNFLTNLRDGSSSTSSSLYEWFKLLKDTLPHDTVLTLITVGLENFLKSKALLRKELYDTLVQIQFHTNTVCHRNFESVNDFADFLRSMHKATAKKEQKALKSGRALYHIDGQMSKGKAWTDEEAKIVCRDWWNKMLQQIPRFNVEMAETVVNEYDHPIKLITAYERCKTTEEAVALLKDLVVKKGDGRGTSQKRLGPVMSKRIHSFLTAINGDTLIDEK